MLNVSAMRTNNPVLIGGALLSNVLVGTLTSAYAVMCAMLITLFAVGCFAAKHAKPIALCVAAIAAVVVVFALPQVAVGALCVLVFGAVTKP